MAFLVTTLCLNGTNIINPAIVILISLCQRPRRQSPRLVQTVCSLWGLREGGWRWGGDCFNRCHLSGHQHPENFTFRVVQPAVSKPRPPGSFIPTSQCPLSPLSLSQKAPHTMNKVSLALICWLIWQGSSSPLETKSLNTVRWACFATGRWQTVVFPPSDTQEDPLPSPPRLEQVQGQVSMTSLYQIKEVWFDSTPGRAWRRLPSVCLSVYGGTWTWEVSRDRPQRGSHTSWSDTDTKSGWFLASSAACHTAFITGCLGLLLTVLIHVGPVLLTKESHNGRSCFSTVQCTD